MKIEPNTSKTLKFQEQIIPPYLGESLDFYWKADFLSTSENFQFGLKSSDGTKRVKYSFQSGILYDYSDRIVGAYRGGLSLEYGLQSGADGYSSYQKINSRPISFNDFYSGYELKPFDRIYVENSGQNPVEFDLELRGFAPPVLFSSLSLVDGFTYSGNISQSGWAENLSQGVKLGMFGLSVPAANGSVLSFDSSGSGILNYYISGNSLAAGQVFPIEFNTYFGKVQRNVTVVGQGGGGSVEGGETGISLSLYGNSNLLPANGQLDFSISYFSNAENEVTVNLTSPESFSVPVLSGSGAGFLNYSGFVSKSGLIYSDSYITGVADLESLDNAAFNTEYDLFDRYIDIKKRVGSRTTGVYYTGVNSFTYTGVPMYGTYNGPYPPFIGLFFSGLGDITVSHDFVESDQGVYTFNEELAGFLNSSYSGQFAIASSVPRLSTDPIFYSSNNPVTFPTGQAFGLISSTVTGRGIVSQSVEYPSFFGEGTGRVFTSRIETEGTGFGDVSFSGSAYEWNIWSPPFYETPDSLGGAIVDLQPYKGEGILSNGITTFKGTGLPNPVYTTGGFPTGPSRIIVKPQLLEVYSDLEIDFIEGFFYLSGSQSIVPTGFGFTGRAVGYVNYGGGSFEGPVFPEPNDSNFYPYNGNSFGLLVEGEAFYGRGIIYSSGSVDDGATHRGIFVTAEEEGELSVSYNIQTGQYRATYEAKISKAAFAVNQIYPARFIDVGEGQDFLNYDAVSLEFINPLIDFTTGANISGKGFVPTSNLNEKYNLFYSETPDSFPELGYKEQGWFTPSEFERPTPYSYPVGEKIAYVRVKSTSSDPDSFDSLSLKVSAANVTGEVVITTNTSI